ncbi:MAG: hypothetical protein CMC93_05425 [Flavobacteriaceae bacterium]|nr:hypothetical protein [Flavobacteriaceae bacterium]
MFKYCLWYKIHPNHIVNHTIRNYCKTLSTPLFTGHITIKTGLSLSQAEDLFETYKYHKKPTFVSYGQYIVEKTIIDNHYFFSIEQPFSIDGVRIRGIHASLAYRINVPFLATEIKHKPLNDVIITPDDITICIANCSSEVINEWTIYREHKY